MGEGTGRELFSILHVERDRGWKSHLDLASCAQSICSLSTLEQGRQARGVVSTVSSVELFLYTKPGRVPRHRLSSPLSIPWSPG